MDSPQPSHQMSTQMPLHPTSSLTAPPSPSPIRGQPLPSSSSTMLEPPSTQIVKYGTPMSPSNQYQEHGNENGNDLQIAFPAEYRENVPRILSSLPSLQSGVIPSSDNASSHQPRYQNQYQHDDQPQQQQYQYQISQSTDVVKYIPAQGQNTQSQYPNQNPNQNQNQDQHFNESPKSNSNQGLLKTPKRNVFALPPPPPNHSPQIASSPIHGHNTTPDRPTDPQSMPVSCPGASSRVKQSTSGNGEETTYKLAPPAGKLVKRVSKGVNASFTVPWAGNIKERMEATTAEKERERQQEMKQQESQLREQQSGKEKEMKEQVEDNQVHSAKETGAQKRAQAVLEAAAQQALPIPVMKTDSGMQNTVQRQYQHHQQQQREPQQAQFQSGDSNVQEGESRAQNQAQINDTLVKQSRSRPTPNVPNAQKQARQPPQTVLIQDARSGPQQLESSNSVQSREPSPQQPRAKQNAPQPQSGPRTLYRGGPIRPQPFRSQTNRDQRPKSFYTDHERQYTEDMQQDGYKSQQMGSYQQGGEEGDVFGPESSYRHNQHHQQSGTEYPSDPSHPRDNAYDHDHHPQQPILKQGPKSKSNSKRSRESRETKSSPLRYPDQDQPQHQQPPRPQKRSKHSGEGFTPPTSSTLDGDGGGDAEMAPAEAQGNTGEEEEAEEVSSFDAFAEIERYDHVKELQEPWNEMMDGMIPFIDDWAERYLSTTMDTIYGVYGCFYNMSAKNAESLEQGVKSIQAYQETQNQIRQTLVDFRNGVAMISERLVDPPGGGGGMASPGGMSRGGTPSTPSTGSGGGGEKRR